jgi:hypothetical protein
MCIRETKDRRDGNDHAPIVVKPELIRQLRYAPCP